LGCSIIISGADNRGSGSTADGVSLRSSVAVSSGNGSVISEADWVGCRGSVAVNSGFS
jgi:hypothetical protein